VTDSDEDILAAAAGE